MYVAGIYIQVHPTDKGLIFFYICLCLIFFFFLTLTFSIVTNELTFHRLKLINGMNGLAVCVL